MPRCSFAEAIFWESEAVSSFFEVGGDAKQCDGPDPAGAVSKPVWSLPSLSLHLPCFLTPFSATHRHVHMPHATTRHTNTQHPDTAQHDRTQIAILEHIWSTTRHRFFLKQGSLLAKGLGRHSKKRKCISWCFGWMSDIHCHWEPISSWPLTCFRGEISKFFFIFTAFNCAGELGSPLGVAASRKPAGQPDGGAPGRHQAWARMNQFVAAHPG